MYDEDVYPSDEDLERIAKWDYKDFKGLMKFVHSLWWMSGWGWTQEGNKFSISTGGWSGNEDLIRALRKNAMFWMTSWSMSRRGGHHEFEIPEQLFPPDNQVDLSQDRCSCEKPIIKENSVLCQTCLGNLPKVPGCMGASNVNWKLVNEMFGPEDQWKKK